MNAVIVGTGYVGLVTGACFAEIGVQVTCVDIDRAKIEQLRGGIIPIYEPGLDELVAKNVRQGRLHFATDLAGVLAAADIVFIAVGTPPGEDGAADVRQVEAVARQFGRHIDHYTVLAVKSTVPVGACARVKVLVAEELAARGADVPFDVVSNPEFLKEGSAIRDFMSPDRVIVGVESEAARALIDRLYKPFLLNGYRIQYMDLASAEMTKYASNAMLAVRISFMNDIANLCERVGADVDAVRKGMGADPRIGGKFLYPGCGYGGSCFPKDVRALARTGREHDYPMRVIEATEAINTDQKLRVVEKLRDKLGSLAGATVALWGLSFKPETDDLREAPSLAVVEALLSEGARVRAFDPVAMDEARKLFGETIEYAPDLYRAARGADALVLLTEWKQFRLPDWQAVRAAMHGNVLIDGRNIYERAELRALGFDYAGIGK